MKKNYPIQWRKWMKSCFKKHAILDHYQWQAKKCRIKPLRGIRQGILSLLFILVLAMDYFSRLLIHLQQKGSIKGVSFNKDCNLTYLLFADDILIFVEDNDEYILNLKNAIFLFEVASGLNINLSKSTISPINIDSCRSKAVANF